MKIIMSRHIKEVRIETITAGTYRLRQRTLEVEDLAESIRSSGLLEPVGLIKTGSGSQHELVYGERRLLACKKLGWEEISAVVFTDPKEALIAAVTENVQRENLNPLEEARGYRKLLDTGMTQVEVAKAVGKGQSYIAHKLRLEKLPLGVITLLDLGCFTEGHLRQLLRLEGIIKKALDNKPHEGWEWFYNPIFEMGRPYGVHDMVTYKQDKVAWSNPNCTVEELRAHIDDIEREYGLRPGKTRFGRFCDYLDQQRQEGRRLGSIEEIDEEWEQWKQTNY